MCQELGGHKSKTYMGICTNTMYYSPLPPPPWMLWHCNLNWNIWTHRNVHLLSTCLPANINVSLHFAILLQNIHMHIYHTLLMERWGKSHNNKYKETINEGNYDVSSKCPTFLVSNKNATGNKFNMKDFQVQNSSRMPSRHSVIAIQNRQDMLNQAVTPNLQHE